MSEWLERTCPECGKSFVTLLSHKRYCSTECGHKYRNKRRYKRKVQQPKRCERCGKEFVASRSDVRCCSRKCRLARYRMTHPDRDYMAEAHRAGEECNRAARVAVSALSESQVDELRWAFADGRKKNKALRMWLEDKDSDSARLKEIRERMR